MAITFRNRTEAGRRLARVLRDRIDTEDAIVLGLPRGGVPVAFEVARELGAPLDVILVRKVGVPFQPELAMGAIGEDGVRIVNESVVRQARVDESEFARVEEHEQRTLEERARRYRGSRSRVPLEGRTAVIVDDGIATGSTVMAACGVARAQGAHRIVVAAPVAPPDTVRRLRSGTADEVVCVATPEPFRAIGLFYDDFTQTTDDEVTDLLQQAQELGSGG